MRDLVPAPFEPQRAGGRAEVTLTEVRSSTLTGPYDGLWPGVAVLDRDGVIVVTNVAWDLFCALNGGTGSTVGMNYIDVCERSGASTVGAGLRSVLANDCVHFDITYACPSPIEDRWYLLQAAQIDGGVLVTHTNVTGQMLVNDSPDLAADDDPLTRLPTLTRGLRLIDDTLAHSSASGVPTMIATIRLEDLAGVALSHGRLARDELVVQAVSRTRRLMRSGDFIIRAEPAVLMLVAGQLDRDGDQLCEELTQVLNMPFQVGPFEMLAAASVAVVTSESPSGIDSFLRRSPIEVRARMAVADSVDAGSSDEVGLDAAIIGSPLPMIVFSLPDQRVRAANRAAADLLGLTPDELTRRHAKQLFGAGDTGKHTVDLSALAAGVLDSYRARRTLVGVDRAVEAAIWVRAIPRRSGAMALLLVLPADHDDLFQLPTRALMGPLAVDLASGTMNDAGEIITLSRANPGVLPIEDVDRDRARELVTHVHPKDRVVLTETFERFRLGRQNSVVAIRVRHAHRGWIPTDCHLFPTGDDNTGEPLGFVLVEASAVVPPSGQVVKLEEHLTRIAAEVDAAGIGRSAPTLSPHSTKDLSALTARQADVVLRLLDGQRVSTIAAALYVSRSTVRNHLAGVYRTFDVHSQSELLEWLRS